MDLCSEKLEEVNNQILPSIGSNGAQATLTYKGTRLEKTNSNCSFCGNSQPEIEKLIAGPGAVFICNQCIELCQKILSNEPMGTEE